MDFLSDQSGRHLLHINGIVEVPEYVKQADIDIDKVDKLPSASFADPVKREFPIDCPPHVFLSYSYCKSAAVNNEKIISRIKQAAIKLHIVNDLNAIDQAFGRVKRASMTPPRHYAIMINFDGTQIKTAAAGEIRGFYPINNYAEIQDSAIALDNDKHRIPLSLYVEGAREIVKAAVTNGLEADCLPKRIQLYGTEHLADFTHVDYEAKRREDITGDSMYSHIAKSAAENEEQQSMDDYAKLWELADASNGLTKYSNTIPDPYRIFNIGVSKQAYEMDLKGHVPLAGAVVPIQAIGEIENDDVLKYFPKIAAASIMELIKVAKASNLDNTDAMMLSVVNMPENTQKALLRLITA